MRGTMRGGSTSSRGIACKEKVLTWFQLEQVRGQAQRKEDKRASIAWLSYGKEKSVSEEVEQRRINS